jgi:hypothetical protein
MRRTILIFLRPDKKIRDFSVKNVTILYRYSINMNSDRKEVILFSLSYVRRPNRFMRSCLTSPSPDIA